MISTSQLPAIYRVPGFAGATVPARDLFTDAPGLLGPVLFRFPAPKFLTGIMLVPRSGDPVDAAALSIAISDNESSQISSDGRGGGLFAEALALSGFSWHPFLTQRPIAGGDTWVITVANTGAAVVLAGLFFYVEAP